MAKLKPEGVMDFLHKSSSVFATLAALAAVIPALLPWQQILIMLSGVGGGIAISGNIADKQ